MWERLGDALALLLVIEGVLPFLNPAGLRRALAGVGQLDDRALRVAGLASMLLGVLLSYLLH